MPNDADVRSARAARERAQRERKRRRTHERQPYDVAGDVGKSALGVLGDARRVREEVLEPARSDDDRLGAGLVGSLLRRIRELVPREQVLRPRIR